MAGGTRDDTGVLVAVPERVRRVVSLVPSLTETVAVTAPGLLAGATDWCSQPAGLDVPRVRGTKTPILTGSKRSARISCWPTRRRTGLPTWRPYGRPGCRYG